MEEVAYRNGKPTGAVKSFDVSGKETVAAAAPSLPRSVLARSMLPPRQRQALPLSDDSMAKTEPGRKVMACGLPYPRGDGKPCTA